MTKRFRLGQAWQLRGRLSLALSCYRAAALEAPEFLPAWFAWLEMAELLGDRAQALEVVERAQAHHPEEIGLESHWERLQDFAYLDIPWRGSKTSAPHILIYTDAPCYGAGEISHALVRDWVGAGYRMTYVQPPLKDHLLKERLALGVAQRFLPPENLYDLSQPARSLLDRSEARRLFQEERPDLVIFADGCAFSNLAAKEAALELGLRVGVIAHAAFEGWLQDYAPYRDRLLSLYQRFPVVTVSEENLHWYRSRLGLPEQASRVILNGRPQQFFQPEDEGIRANLRSRLRLQKEDFLVLTVASLEARKGFPELLSCLPALAQEGFHFAWAGAGTLEAQLRLRTRRLPVHFLGERRDIHQWLDACDAFLLPSHWEGMPLCILEAMAKGRPVLATAVNGVPQAVGEAGQLLPPWDGHAEATGQQLLATLRLWRSRPDLVHTLGERGRERAGMAFREERMLSEYRNWLEEILSPGA